MLLRWQDKLLEVQKTCLQTMPVRCSSFAMKLPLIFGKTLSAFCHELLGTGLSHENSCAFGTYVLLPRFRALARPASRDIVNAAIEIASAQPSAAVDAILFPALRGTPSAACVELVSRVAKTLNADMVSILISRLMGKDMANTSNTSGRGSATQTLLASDNTFGLIKSLLLKKGIILSQKMCWALPPGSRNTRRRI